MHYEDKIDDEMFQVRGVLQARIESAIASVVGCCNYEHGCPCPSRYLLGV